MTERDAILARRAKFLALAIAGISTAGCEEKEPQVCLSVAPPTDAGEPQTCLTYWPLPSTTTTSESTTTSSAASATPSSTTTSTAAQPQPKPKFKPRPRICLSEPFHE